jgi:hypothetical protein
MQVKDIPQYAQFISDSQDVKAVMVDLGIADDDIGAIFITRDGTIYGISGIIPYLEKQVFRLGQDINYAADD